MTQNGQDFGYQSSDKACSHLKAVKQWGSHTESEYIKIYNY